MALPGLNDSQEFEMPQKLSRITVGVLDSLPTCSVHSLTQLVFVGLASGCLVGCYNSEQVCNDAAAVAPSVELGSWTDESFFPIEEEAVVSPVWGPQGGQHIWAAVLAVTFGLGRRGAAAQQSWPEFEKAEMKSDGKGIEKEFRGRFA